MAEESAKLRVPYIAAAQAQKHVTHNEAMTLLDTLVQLSVIDKDLSTPPGSPVEGDTYIVAAGGTGAWIGWDKRIARFIDGTWRSYLPGEGDGAGWLAYVIDESTLYVFTGTAWEQLYVAEGHSGVSSVNGEAGDVTLTLDDLDDIDAPSPGDGHVLAWDDSAGEWVSAAPAGGDPVTLEPEGEWDNGTTYAKLDVVSYEGSSYVSRIDSNSGNQPDTSPTEWMLLASRGESGAAGVGSVNGQTGTVELFAEDIPVTPAGGLAATDAQAAFEELDSDIGGVADDLATHEARTDNPHGVTKSQVGLGSVDNFQQLPASYLDTDTALAANSDAKVPSQKAIKAYVDALLAAQDALVFRGVIDCSANPNYPAASAGHVYKISVAGKIGGGSGPNVEAGDTLYCITDGSSSGTHGSAGANWVIVQVNLDGAVIGPASVTDGHGVLFDGASGKLVKSAGAAPITKAAAEISGITAKTTPVDADVLLLEDSAASNAKKSLTWANLKATLKTYFDTLYQAVDATLTAWAAITVTQGALFYGTAADAFAVLAKDANATRYLANTGSSNNPAWAQVDLSNGVAGDLPLANLAQGDALSVLGVTGNATADNASIAAGSDHQVMRRAGTAVAFGAVNLAQAAAVTGVLPEGNLPDASTSAQGVAEFATAAEFRTGTDTGRSLVVDQVWAAAALTALTDGTNIAVDLATGFNFGGAADAVLALGGNRTLSAPSNLKTGQSGVLWFGAATSTRTLTFNAAWLLMGGVEAGPHSITTAQILGVAYVVRASVVYVTAILRRAA